MKKTLTVIGVLLIIFATISIIDVTQGQSGAGLYGMLTGYIIMLIISGVLIYFGSRSDNVTKVLVRDEIDDKLEKLRDLYYDGYLTQDEFNQKSAKLKADKTKKEVEQTAEYKKLKDLYDDGILTKEEFESKVQKLSTSQSGFLFRKIKEGNSRRIGVYEEYIIDNNLGEKYEHIYKAIKDNRFFIYKEGEILFFDTKSEILNFLKSKKHYKSFTYQGIDYNIADNLSEGYFLISDGNLNYGFANRDKIVTIKPKYEFADSFSNGLALVRFNRKFGFIDYSGKVVIDLMYDDASSFKNGIADVEVGGYKHTINKKGKKI